MGEQRLIGEERGMVGSAASARGRAVWWIILAGIAAAACASPPAAPPAAPPARVGIRAAAAVPAAALDAAQPEAPVAAAARAAPAARTVAVLLINHGSRSKGWRDVMLALEGEVSQAIRATGGADAVRTAFMEYTEPSIATQLRALDDEGFSDVVLVPVFLTVSSHSFDDIPTIISEKEDPKSLETLKMEKIARYRPRARIHRAPLPDFAALLEQNLLRRVRALSPDPRGEALVLIAYGDATYEAEWRALLEGVGDKVTRTLGMAGHQHGWCGHLVHYDPGKTTAAVEAALLRAPRAVVVPVLLSTDEMFQGRIIPDGIARVARHGERVRYRPDAILPDAGAEAWIVGEARRLAVAARGQTAAAPR